MGELTRRGIVIQHARVRASMIGTDPEGAVLTGSRGDVFVVENL